jgi:hypothetical protein
MNPPDSFRNIIATYNRHGWRLRRVLLRLETRATLDDAETDALFGDADVREAEIDALWFARPSQGGRESWELRLVADTPYALFEMFEPDEAEEEREDVRREMEAQLKAKVKR